MKKLVIFVCAFLLTVCPMGKGFSVTEDSITDYQNYNHGYCPSCQCNDCRCEKPSPECNSCPKKQECEDQQEEANNEEEHEDEVAPNLDDREDVIVVCKPKSGFSMMTLGIILVAVAVAATLIVSAGNGSSHQ